MIPNLMLPTAGGGMEEWRMMHETPLEPSGPVKPFDRIAYSAAHIVADPLADIDPGLGIAIDWDTTLSYRRHLWSLGLGVAEAMDTAQRGMGLDWTNALDLIRRSIDASRDYPGALVASGCGTDHLGPGSIRTVDDVIAAYEMQMEAIEALGGRLIIMASRALAQVARSPKDYERVYDRILRQAKQPVVLHWLGEMFDPALAGYWGTTDVGRATDLVLDIIAAHAPKVDGIKVSLLNASHEVSMRRRLPAGVRMYTGDDFNFPELIAGDEVGALPEHRRSDALLGIFDAIAPIASAALGQLAAGDVTGFHATLAPTVPLSRHMFKAPTRFYKTSVVFMAWLNGHQDHFAMVGGQQGMRSVLHLTELFRLADRAGALQRPELAAARIRSFLMLNGC